MRKYYKKVKPSLKHRELITVLNGVLQLTPREQDLLVVLMHLDSTWPEDTLGAKNILSMDSRKHIMKSTNLSKAALSIYLKNMLDKGIILKPTKGESHVNPVYLDDAVDNKYEVTFILDYNE